MSEPITVSDCLRGLCVLRWQRLISGLSLWLIQAEVHLPSLVKLGRDLANRDIVAMNTTIELASDKGNLRLIEGTGLYILGCHDLPLSKEHVKYLSDNIHMFLLSPSAKQHDESVVKENLQREFTETMRCQLWHIYCADKEIGVDIGRIPRTLRSSLSNKLPPSFNVDIVNENATRFANQVFDKLVEEKKFIETTKTNEIRRIKQINVASHVRSIISTNDLVLVKVDKGGGVVLMPKAYQQALIRQAFESQNQLKLLTSEEANQYPYDRNQFFSQCLLWLRQFKASDYFTEELHLEDGPPTLEKIFIEIETAYSESAGNGKQICADKCQSSTVKVHKSFIEMRLVNNFRKMPYYKMAVYIQWQLQALYDRIEEKLKEKWRICKDINPFLQWVELLNPSHLRSLAHCTFFEMDIKKLYPSMPTAMKKFWNSIEKFILSHLQLSARQQELLHVLLRAAKKCNAFLIAEFGDMHYKLQNGITAGAPFSPVIALFYVAVLHERIDQRLRQCELYSIAYPAKWQFWQPLLTEWCYMDDICGVHKCALCRNYKKGNCAMLLLVVDTFESVGADMSLSFTKKISCDEAQFCGAMISKSKNFDSDVVNSSRKLIITPYVDKHKLYHYLSFHSAHDRSVLGAIVTQAVRREVILCSRYKDFEKGFEKIVDRFLGRGYPFDFIVKYASKIEYSKRLEYIKIVAAESNSDSRNDNSKRKKVFKTVHGPVASSLSIGNEYKDFMLQHKNEDINRYRNQQVITEDDVVVTSKRIQNSNRAFAQLKRNRDQN